MNEEEKYNRGEEEENQVEVVEEYKEQVIEERETLKHVNNNQIITNLPTSSITSTILSKATSTQC